MTGCLLDIAVVAAIGGVIGVGSYQIMVRKRSPVAVLLISTVILAVITAIVVPLANPRVSPLPVVMELGAGAVFGSLLILLLTWIRRSRGR